MIRLLKYIICFVLLSMGALSLNAQSLPFKHYSFKDGLPASPVKSIFQDAAGYLWFGTEGGLCRFDGLYFHQIHGDSKGVFNGYISAIQQDSQGTLWIGRPGLTLGSVVSYSPSSGKIHVYSKKNGLLTQIVTSIYIGNGDRIWVGTADGVYILKDNRFEPYRPEEPFFSNKINTITSDLSGNIWLGTRGGAGKINHDNTLTVYNKKNGLSGESVYALLADNSGNMWIGTSNGLSVLSKKGLKNYSVKDGLPDPTIGSLLEDPVGRIWIGTRKGLSIFSGNKFTNYFMRPDIPGNKIGTIFMDREKNIWLGTYLGANCIISADVVKYSFEDGLPHNLVWSVYKDSRGCIWLCTDRGLCCYRDGRFEVDRRLEPLAADPVFCLMEDKSGNLIAGTGRGLVILKKGKLKRYSMTDGLPSNIVVSLSQDKSGTVWIGTNHGLCILENGSIRRSPFSKTSTSILAILKDKKGDIWFSNTSVLNRVSGSKLDRFSVDEGLIHPQINSLQQDSRGRIWVSTKGGLSCYDGTEFCNFTEKEGLANNLCHFVIEDNDRNLWIGTVKGINKMDGDSLEIYPAISELVTFETMQGACVKDEKGYIWFGTINGVTRFNPQARKSEPTPPPVYITGFKVHNEPLPLTPPARLEYEQNYVNFDFIGLSYSSPTNIRYRYRLEGVDVDWLETSNRSIPYAYLPPGRYNFQVSALNNDGIMSTEPASLEFEILPPVWQTWWFRLIGLIVLVSLMVAVFLWRSRTLQERIELRERNAQLVMAQKMELVGIMAGGAVHDLKNLMAIIINYSGLAARYMGKENGTGKFIDKIKHTASTAAQLAKQILAFTRRKHDDSKPVNLPDLLRDILNILKITLLEGVQLNVHISHDTIRMPIHPTKFQQVVMNLCINAYQAMPDGGALTVSLSSNDKRADERSVILEISDTGMGMEPEMLEWIFEPLYTEKKNGEGTGLGLFVVRQVTHEYDGKITVRSQPGQGTTFRLEFPLESPAAAVPNGFASNRDRSPRGG